MRTLTQILLLTTLTTACAPEPDPIDQAVTLPPGAGIRPIRSVPGGDAAVGLLFGPGTSFVMSGPTAPGSASFTGALYFPMEHEPTAAGSGSVNITVDAQLYSGATETLATTLDDDNANAYLALLGYAQRTGPGGTTLIDQVIFVVPETDFAVGTTVALDGDERIAMFASGDAEADEPEVFAAATTGSVTFTAGAIGVGNSITATVSGDFGSVEFVPGGGGGGGTITDGTYTLAISGPADVYCDGNLIGQEAAFASITAASLDMTSGSVNLANGSNLVTIAGAPIASAFGAASLQLDPQNGLYAGFTDESVPGQAGTTRVGKYLVIDSDSASPTFINAAVGAGYVTSDGQCSVAFGASLTAP